MKLAVQEKDIISALRSTGEFKILIRCARGTGLFDLLRDTDSRYTLLAPPDRAFKKLVPYGQLKSLLDDKALLTRTLRYHVIPKIVMFRHLDGVTRVRTLEGRAVLFNTTGTPRINGSFIVRPDIECGNGVIHEIDSVLTLP